VLEAPTLTIVDGVTRSAAPVTPPPNSFGGVRPMDLLTPPTAGQPAQQPSPLCVARFSSAGPPVVLLGLTLGGAHCCTVVRAYVVDSAAVKPLPDEDLGNPGAALESSHGASIIVTADNAFAYEFDSFAGSAMPVKVVAVVGNQFIDVTRLHLDLVRTDAAMMWSILQKTNDTLGLVAAWVADQCELGQEPNAWATVSTLQGEGRLGATVAGSGGAQFVSDLHAFLSAHHYCTT
jgi:hypothetical protein